MNGLLQIRIDENLKNEASAVFEAIGIDISTAVRIFLKKSVAINGIPFELVNEKRKEEFLSTVKELQDVSKSLGNSEMTLEEINEIITDTRNSKKK